MVDAFREAVIGTNFAQDPGDRLCSDPWRTRQSLLRHIGVWTLWSGRSWEDGSNKFRARIWIRRGDGDLLCGALLQVSEKFMHKFLRACVGTGYTERGSVLNKCELWIVCVHMDWHVRAKLELRHGELTISSGRVSPGKDAFPWTWVNHLKLSSLALEHRLLSASALHQCSSSTWRECWQGCFGRKQTCLLPYKAPRFSCLYSSQVSYQNGWDEMAFLKPIFKCFNFSRVRFTFKWWGI